MKRLIFSILGVSLLFLGVGAVVDRTSARYKSDDKALELVRKARVAIGGDAAIAGIQSVVITGRTTQTLKINGVERTESGESEIAMQMPDKVSRIVKIGTPGADGKAFTMDEKTVDVVVVGDAKAAGEGKMKVTVNAENGNSPTTNLTKKVIIKKDDGTVQELNGADADAWIAAHPGEGDIRKEIVIRHADGTVEKSGTGESKVMLRKAEGGNATFTSKDGKTFDVVMARGGHEAGVKSNEMLRLTLGLLLTAPTGMDVEYTLGGTGDVDGRDANIVVASFAGQSFKLYLDSSSNLPLAIGYKGMAAPHVMTFKHDGPPPAPGAEKDVMVFKREGGPIETADVLVKFSDYRAVNGVQLPFKWTQVGGGDNVFDVTGYDVNPANIASKFADQKVFVRTKQ